MCSTCNDDASLTCTTNECRDCVYDEWQEWSPCGTTCGNSNRVRVRNFTEPVGNGEPCMEGVLEFDRCVQDPCPGENRPTPCAPSLIAVSFCKAAVCFLLPNR